MRPIPVIFHLNIHKLAFHLKFPATLVLELQIDKQLSLIADDIPLGKETINVNKQIKRQICLNYQESTKRYEEKKVSIIISIKTKTSENRLTAGVLPISLSKLSAHVSNQKGKPLRCNDPKAFIEYSIRTETVHKTQPKNEAKTENEAFQPRESKKTGKDIFKSAVHYNNHQQEDTHSDNELQKYLAASISREDRHDRQKYKSSHKISAYSLQNGEEDDSRTEKMSYRKLKNAGGKDHSISSSQDNQYERKVNQLSKKSDAISRQAKQLRVLNQNLKAENKQLKTKIKKYEAEIDEQSSLILGLNRKLELKDNFSLEQTKQLKLKLQETETQLHQIMMEKNLLLNQWEAKEKEIMILFKDKQKALIEEKKKMVIEIDRKSLSAESFKHDLEEMQQSKSNSQKIIQTLRQEKQKIEEKFKNMQNHLENLKNEMNEKGKTIQNLQMGLQNKEKLFEQQKTHKKTIFELKRERDQKERMIKQNGLSIQQLQGKLKEKDQLISRNEKKNNFLMLQCQSLRQKIKEQNDKNVELTNKAKSYEKQLRRTSQNSDKISTQIKEVETQLNTIKKQANTSIGQKSKLIAEYERFISVLKDKIEMILQQKSEAQQKYEETNKLLRNKEDEWYELGQQLIFIKEENSNLTSENQMLREENAYLNKSITELTEKQEKLLRLQEKLEYNDRLYDELQQRFQLQRIELENEIRSLQQKNEEKYYALNQVSEQLRKAEREELQYRDQIETLRLALNNKVSELNYLKIQSQRYRQNNIQFEERMAALRRIQDTATTSIQQLQEENIVFKNMIKENQEAITTLGKRYDKLYKSTLQSLNQIMDILKSQKIGNSFVRHEKSEISSVMNDFIRFVAIQRDYNSQEISSLKQQLSTQTAINKENAKIIKVKSQIQAEQEEEIRSIKALVSNLQDKIAKLQNDVYLRQKDIKERQGSIADLQKELERTHKQQKNELLKKDEAIGQVQASKEKLNQQLLAQAERYNLNNQKWKTALQDLQNNMNIKITALNETISLLSNDLKSQRDTTKQLKSHIHELQQNNAKLAKQTQEMQQDLDRRVKELIASRIQCDNKNKKIIQKEDMVAQTHKKYLKLENDNAKQMAKTQRIEAEYKESCIRKSELEATLKERNNEILALKLRIDETQDAKNKLISQKEELIKSKATQDSLVSSLNQTIKTLKQSIIKNQQTIKKIFFQKQCVEKDYTKKINIMINEKSSSQKQLNDYRSKTGARQVEQSSKEKKLSEELKAAKLKITEQAATIQQLSSQLQECNKRISNLTSEFNNKSAQIQSKQRSLLPNSAQIKEIIQSVAQLRTIGKQYETNKNKLLKTCQIGLKANQPLDYACEIARQLNISINRIKIQVLNKLKFTTQVKTVMLDQLKKLQVVIQKLQRSP